MSYKYSKLFDIAQFNIVELETQQHRLLNARRLTVGLAVSAVALTPAIDDAHAQAEGRGAAHIERQTRDDEWKLVWRDSFDGTELSERWQITGPMYGHGLRFEQYRTSKRNVAVRGGKLVITSLRECSGVPSVAPCPEGTETVYTSGRVEEKIHSISGDFKLVIKAKAPGGRVRGEGWANTGDNYCIADESDLGEVDIFETLGDAENSKTDFTTANNIVHCDHGKLHDVPRKQEFPKGWLQQPHEFSVERIGNATEFFVDGEPIPLRKSPGRTSDTPRDFKGVSRAEFDAVQQLNYGFILSTYVFNDPSATSKNFLPVDDSEDFKPQRFSIYRVEYYAK